MISRSMVPLLFCLLIPNGAGAQNAYDTTAATGDYGYSSDYTRQGGGGVVHHNQAYDRSMPLGSIFGVDTGRTRTRNYLGNSGGLARATTQLIAPGSVNMAPIPSGTWSLGFGGGSPQAYTGPGSGNGLGPGIQLGTGFIPFTGTGSVDVDVFGPGYNTGFRFEQQSPYNKVMMDENMPSTFNELGGTDDQISGF